MEFAKRSLSFAFISLSIFFLLDSRTAWAGPGASLQGQTPPVAKRVVPSGWKVFRGQQGLVAFIPGGWNVQELGGGAFVVHDQSGPNGAALALVYVQPFEKLEGPIASVFQGLDRIAPALFPRLAVVKFRVASSGQQPEVAVAEISFTPKDRPFQGSAMCFREGLRGVIYVIASTPENWLRYEPVMKQILTGFFYSASSGPRGGLPKMTLWRDPQEGAFTVPVPEGWSVEGGMKRFSAVDTRPEVFADSPDNTVWVSIGNSQVPPFSLPTQMGMSMGLTEGQWYSPDGGLNKFMVMRYLPAASFLKDYYLPQEVGAVSGLQVRDLPELAMQAAQKYQMAGFNLRIDAAEVTFDANTEAGPRKGYAFAQTMLLPQPGAEGGMWHVTNLYTYQAEAKAEPLAQALLVRMVQGFRFDPNWEAGQIRTAGQVSQIISQTQNEIMNIINSTFEHKWQVLDRVFDDGSRARRGQLLIEDPVTGEHFEVPNGSNYYFRVGPGNDIVGTDSPNMPNYWLREMQIIR